MLCERPGTSGLRQDCLSGSEMKEIHLESPKQKDSALRESMGFKSEAIKDVVRMNRNKSVFYNDNQRILHRV